MSPRLSELHEILTLVDKLTKPYLVEHEVEQGRKIIRSKVVHEALLDQLEKLKSSSSGSGLGGGVLASERSLINAEAIELSDKMHRAARNLYAGVTSSKPFATAKENLRQWYIELRLLQSQGKVSDQKLRILFQRLQAMALAVEAKLNPPTILEITAPCPRCLKQYGHDQDGVFRRAVIVESRVHAERSLQNTRAKCVACGAVWVNGNGMRQLRYEIDVAEDFGENKLEKIEQMFDNSATLESAGAQLRPEPDGVSE